MAKQNKRVRSSVCDPEEIDQILNYEFNPVKEKLEGMTAKELLEKFGSYYATSEKSFHDCIDPFLEQFNPVKIENEQPQPKQPGMAEEAAPNEVRIKTTAGYDNSRLEFLRMQIGPVQNFYQTLGNILYSLSIRLDVVEEKIENLKTRLDQAVLERRLFGRYLEYCTENNLVCTVNGFIDFIKEHAEEELNGTETDKE